jgi:hypothetical protein
VLLRADDIVHDDHAPVQAQIDAQGVSRLGVSLHAAPGQRRHVMAHVPSHHNHTVGEWIGIRAEVDHVVTFARLPAGHWRHVQAKCAAACSAVGDPANGEHAVTLVRGAAARAPSTVGAAD